MSLERAFRSVGVSLEEMEVSEAMGRPERLIRWPKRKNIEALVTLDLGGMEALSWDVSPIQEIMRVPWLIWFVDDPGGYSLRERCNPEWTVLFCWDEILCQDLASEGQFKAYYLPLAADPEISPKRWPNRGSDVRFPGIFVGSIAHSNWVLEDLAKSSPVIVEYAEKVWTSYRRDLGIRPDDLVWEQAALLAKRPAFQIKMDPLWRLWVASCLHVLGKLKRTQIVLETLGQKGVVGGDTRWRELFGTNRYLGSIPYGPRLFQLYEMSAFLLDVRQPQARSAPTQRVFDGPLCGRPVLAEWSVELEDLFDVGSEVLAYRSVDHAVEGKDRLLRSPKEALLMGQRARKRVLLCHTYKARARVMLDVLIEEMR